MHPTGTEGVANEAPATRFAHLERPCGPGSPPVPANRCGCRTFTGVVLGNGQFPQPRSAVKLSRK